MCGLTVPRLMVARVANQITCERAATLAKCILKIETSFGSLFTESFSPNDVKKLAPCLFTIRLLNYVCLGVLASGRGLALPRRHSMQKVQPSLRQDNRAHSADSPCLPYGHEIGGTDLESNFIPKAKSHHRRSFPTEPSVSTTFPCAHFGTRSSCPSFHSLCGTVPDSRAHPVR